MESKDIAWSATIAAVILMVGGCADYPESDFTTMCENSSHVRIDDSECNNNSPGSSLMYISTYSDYNAPSVGGKIDQTKVVRSLPAGKSVQIGGIPKTGSVVKSSPGITRGGFGSTSTGGSSGS